MGHLFLLSIHLFAIGHAFVRHESHRMCIEFIVKQNNKD